MAGLEVRAEGLPDTDSGREAKGRVQALRDRVDAAVEAQDDMLLREDHPELIDVFLQYATGLMAEITDCDKSLKGAMYSMRESAFTLYEELWALLQSFTKVVTSGTFDNQTHALLQSASAAMNVAREAKAISDADVDDFAAASIFHEETRKAEGPVRRLALSMQQMQQERVGDVWRTLTYILERRDEFHTQDELAKRPDDKAGRMLRDLDERVATVQALLPEGKDDTEGLSMEVAEQVAPQMDELELLVEDTDAAFIARHKRALAQASDQLRKAQEMYRDGTARNNRAGAPRDEATMMLRVVASKLKKAAATKRSLASTGKLQGDSLWLFVTSVRIVFKMARAGLNGVLMRMDGMLETQLNELGELQAKVDNYVVKSGQDDERYAKC